jgi:hypothetical protein
VDYGMQRELLVELLCSALLQSVQCVCVCSFLGSSDAADLQHPNAPELATTAAAAASKQQIVACKTAPSRDTAVCVLFVRTSVKPYAESGPATRAPAASDIY